MLSESYIFWRKNQLKLSFLYCFYTPSNDKEIIPTNITAINKYCIRVNFSFNIILDRIKDIITVPAPRITAATPVPSERANR